MKHEAWSVKLFDTRIFPLSIEPIADFYAPAAQET
jgi:hypothetical protein